jgi:hypothetical protein
MAWSWILRCAELRPPPADTWGTAPSLHNTFMLVLNRWTQEDNYEISYRGTVEPCCMVSCPIQFIVFIVSTLDIELRTMWSLKRFTADTQVRIMLIRSKSLWRWNIDTNIRFLDIIHCPVSF